MDHERLIAGAPAGIKGQTRQCHLTHEKAVVIIGHSRPAAPALAKFDGQPHDHRRFMSDRDQTRRSALDDASHTSDPPRDEATVSLPDKYAVVPDKRPKHARGARVRHKRQRQRAFAGTRRPKDQNSDFAVDNSRRMEACLSS
jgi:hypothetical protein